MVRPWRNKDLEAVAHLYTNTTLSIDEIAQQMNRTKASIDTRLRRLGLQRRQNYRPYTNKERTYIESVIKQKTLREIAVDLNRSYDSVRQFVRLNGIRRSPTRQERQRVLDFINERLKVTKSWDEITYDVVVKFGVVTNKHALYQRWYYHMKNKGVAHAQVSSLDR
ncbi:hypothetical protein O8H94_001001 [Escherichia coli O157]|nr:hypothetical protein [Escherichia coli O157]EKH6024469.1 hypothetical protein [Escherichia coli O157]EKH6093905.1 hypothetical protein [Escherichia coli O157]